MKKKAIALLFGCTMFVFNGAGFASVSQPAIHENTGQVCNVGNDALCNAITDEMMKELIKQTVYTVGTKVLNKINSAPLATPVPQVVAPAAPAAPVVTTVVPATTTATPAASQPATTSVSPAEDMIILQ